MAPSRTGTLEGMSTAVKVVLWVLGGAVTLVLIGVGALWWGLSGGWDGVRPAAQPEDRDVVDAREAGHEPLAALADPTAAALAEVGADLGREEVDQCSEGQNNWKIQDGWTLSCSQASVTGWEVAGSTTAQVDATATDVDARLRSLGWVPTSYGEMELRATGENAEGRYEHPDDPEATLVVDVAAPGQADPYVSLGRYGPTREEGDAQPVLDALASSSGVTVLAVVERTYFQDG